MPMDVSVIIPAYNEESRVAEVVRAAKGASTVGRVIVVDDGSSDGTARAAQDAGADVLCLHPNRGKAGAMDAGVRAVLDPLVVFLDADLSGLTPPHVVGLVDPVLSGRAGMSIGLITEGRAGKSQGVLPVLAGQRAMHRILWLRLVALWPSILRQRFGVEIGLTWMCNRCARVEFVKLVGVGHAMKEQKYGALEGGVRRALMYADIWKTMKHLRGM